jgi:hypothetical protein
VLKLFIFARVQSFTKFRTVTSYKSGSISSGFLALQQVSFLLLKISGGSSPYHCRVYELFDILVSSELLVEPAPNCYRQCEVDVMSSEGRTMMTPIGG